MFLQPKLINQSKPSQISTYIHPSVKSLALPHFVGDLVIISAQHTDCIQHCNFCTLNFLYNVRDVAKMVFIDYMNQAAVTSAHPTLLSSSKCHVGHLDRLS